MILSWSFQDRLYSIDRYTRSVTGISSAREPASVSFPSQFQDVTNSKLHHEPLSSSHSIPSIKIYYKN